MGLMDKAKEMKDKVKDAMSKTSDEDYDKMADKAKGATGGKYDETIDKAAEKAKRMNDQP